MKVCQPTGCLISAHLRPLDVVLEGLLKEITGWRRATEFVDDVSLLAIEMNWDAADAKRMKMEIARDLKKASLGLCYRKGSWESDHRWCRDALKEELVGYVDKGNRSIVLDLSEVSFIDSSGLGALIARLKRTGDDSQLVLRGARDLVANMFKLKRMNKVFRMFHCREEAVSSLSENSEHRVDRLHLAIDSNLSDVPLVG